MLLFFSLTIQTAFFLSSGVCLQWELGPVEYPFEPAAFYDLYSYASSDVDPHFPLSSDVWQKVSPVTRS